MKEPNEKRNRPLSPEEILRMVLLGSPKAGKRSGKVKFSSEDLAAMKRIKEKAMAAFRRAQPQLLKDAEAERQKKQGRKDKGDPTAEFEAQ
jgi:hypothetical protein